MYGNLHLGDFPFGDKFLRLHEKVAVVTGSGRGLGAAIAERLADEGTRVVVVDIDGEAAQKVSESLTKQGHENLAIALSCPGLSPFSASNRALWALGCISEQLRYYPRCRFPQNDRRSMAASARC
ncbi:SDR family NAD(P)-dependent oxidoreductase [Vreelandella venusta]|uniref:SDR family NAD(P)-dependent oxidoreductase n=1 Tax=Vreelandella venusta TaxID=44935 RepID=A0AAP9ZD64_9GAMM|nr:SDR family NAD(P)-dependent oxidoreductase [Halomonas venusta]